MNSRVTSYSKSLHAPGASIGTETPGDTQLALSKRNGLMEGR